MEDMRKKLPDNVAREITRHKKPVFYYRVGKGKRTRLPDISDPEFAAAYAAACAGKPFVRKKPGVSRTGTLQWLVTEYKKTISFRALDPITQRRRDSFYQQMVEHSGDELIKNIKESDIVDGREARSHGKGHAASNFMKAVRPLFAYAKSRGWIDVDPARNVDSPQTINGTRSIWTPDDWERFEARHPIGTMANLAIKIMLFTGLRRADVAVFGRQHIRDGVVHFRPGKTRDTTDVAVTFTALPPLLDAIAATRAAGGMTLLVTEHGLPFASSASFGNWFADRCREAGVSARAHGLRKLGSTLAAEQGASAHELMAMWGWTTLAQAELYTRAADRKRLGTTAASKLMAGFAEQKANSIPRTFDEGAGMEQK